MNRIELTKYIQEVYSVAPEYLWSKFPNYVIFRHKDSSKWFAVIMDVPASKLSSDEKDNIIDIVNLKAIPELVGSLRLQQGIYPAYHMNKEHWVSVRLGDEFNKNKIKDLIEDSYQLTKK